MRKIIEPNKGIYILEIYSHRFSSLENKTFADIELKAGYYYYAGSSQTNLIKRVQRHLKKGKILNWHIDYITANENFSITAVYFMPGAPKEMECSAISKLSALRGIEFPIKNFGNGDCKTCYSHLLYSGKRLTQSHFISLYQSTVRWIPSSKETF